MGDIYSSATRAVVWLGRPTPAMALAMSNARCCRFFERSYTHKPVYWSALEFTATFSRRMRRKRLNVLLRVQEGRLDILTHPYWTRM